MAAQKLSWLGPAVLVGSLSPIALIALDAVNGNLGANPIERILNQTGLLALILLVASLATTPLRLITGWTWPARIRKMLGLLAFLYALLHFLTYAALDRVLDFETVVEDIAERPFITVGFLALLVLIPLAATSTRGAVKRLGFVRWQRLHRLVYLAAGLAIIHFVWRVKQDATEPLIYAAVLGLLFVVRIAWPRRKKPARPPRTPSRGADALGDD